MPPEVVRPYRYSAAIYDRIYAWKDYAEESRRLRRWIQRYGRRGSRTLLDVACGTGNHLRYLSRHFQTTGVDADAGMLREARRKLPDVRFVRARMETFDLGRRFDVITCLFSAIGHVRSSRDLTRTLRTFAKHLEPGGLVLIEPWLTRETYRPGYVHLGIYGGKRWPIARMNLSAQRGSRSIMDMHHLVATPRGVQHWVEHHDLGMFDRATFLAAFRAAGFRARYRRNGLMPGRGMYVAVLRPEGRPRSAIRG